MDSNGNGISLLDDHIADTRAPLSLLLALPNWDLFSSARTLGDQLPLDGDGNLMLEEMRKKWFLGLTEITPKHTVGVWVYPLRHKSAPVHLRL